MSQEVISLVLEPREVTGKAVKHLRKAGTIPAVIHDHGKPSINVQSEYQAILKTLKQAGKHHPIQISTGSKKFVALIKSADFSPKRNELTHVVFNAVNATEKVAAEVPVHAKYAEGNESSPAERAGFMVLAQLDTISIEAIASQLPDVLYYDAEKLVNVGDHVTVADLVMPKGVEAKIEGTHAIATVFEPSALAAANDAAGGDAEPGDEANVDADTAPSDDTSGEDEQRPGGKKEKEDNSQAQNPTKQ